MFCPQGHGSWPGEECGLCGVTGIGPVVDPDGAATSYDGEAQYEHLPRMAPMTRSLLVDMNSLFDDWASGRVY